MDPLQQRIIEIALQIPGYLGYEAKERRRDVDKHTRMQLAGKYDAVHTHLSRIARSAPIQFSVGLENLDQKLQRLIARFQTAPRGYAGWFDAAQIVEEDLDALTSFDAALAGGVAQLQAAIDSVASAIKSSQLAPDAIASCAELLDNLNTQFDQREQLLATGKKPSLDTLSKLASPLDALKPKTQPHADFAALTNLKVNDAVSYDRIDYIISGKIAYNAANSKFLAFLIKDAGKTAWLRVGPADETALCQTITITLPDPPPASIEYDTRTFTKSDSGTASVTVEGEGGTRRGSVTFSAFRAGQDCIWLEDFGTERRVMAGTIIDPADLKLYRR